MATKGGSVVFEFEGDSSKLEKEIDTTEAKIKRSSKATAIANGSLTSILKEQEQQLQELKQKYLDVASSQGKNSDEALKLKSKYSTLSSEINSNKNTINNLESELGSLDKTSKKTSNSLSKIGSSIKTGMVSGLKIASSAVIATATAFASLIGYGAKFNAEIEQYQTSFEVMTGSAEEATKLVADLKQMGAETPFELSDLAETTQLLMNYGFEAEEAKDRLKMLGDISQGSAEKMNRIAMAYGQMSSAGKVQLEDIKQMIEAGFNPLQEISESTGESMASLYDRISNGTLSIDEITASMERSTSVGGKYFQSMEKQSQTVNGQISTLQDNFKSLAGTLAGGFSDSLATEILPGINNALQDLNTAFEEGGISGFSAKLGEELANAITAVSEKTPEFVDAGIQIIDSLVQGLNDNMSAIMTALTNAAVSIVNAIPQILPTILNGNITAIQTLLTQLTPQIPIIVQNLLNGLIQIVNQLAILFPTLIPQLIQAILGIVPVLINNLPTFVNAGIQLLIGLAQGLINAIPILMNMLPEIVTSLINGLLTALPQLMALGPTLILSLAQGLINAIPSLILATPKMIKAIIDGLISGIPNFLSVGKDMVKGLWDGLLSSLDWLKKKIKSWVGNVLEFIKGLFGIHSPSTEFAFIGKMNVLGLEGGMEDMQGELNDTINSMINLSPSLLASASNTYNPNINVAVNNSFEQDPLGQMVQKRKTFASGAKNDYNFGMGV